MALNGFLYTFDIEKYVTDSSHKSVVTLGLFLLQDAAFLIPLYFIIWRRYRLKAVDFGIKHIGFWQTLVWILKAYGLVMIFNFLYVLVAYYSGFDEAPGFGRQEPFIPLFGESTFDLAVAIFVLVIAAPIIEELIFRSFILQTFLARFKPWIASSLTALIFAVIHFDFQSVAIIFVLGLILNWIFIRSRSIIPCIGFHMVNNSIAFLVEFLVSKGYLHL